jgi:hypothetical protein
MSVKIGGGKCAAPGDEARGARGHRSGFAEEARNSLAFHGSDCTNSYLRYVCIMAPRRPNPRCDPLLLSPSREREGESRSTARAPTPDCSRIVNSTTHLASTASPSQLSEVRRSYEHRLVVGDTGLRMENATGTFGVQRSRVVEHVWTRRSWPVGVPETIGEPTHQLFRSGGIAPLALDV